MDDEELKLEDIIYQIPPKGLTDEQIRVQALWCAVHEGNAISFYRPSAQIIEQARDFYQYIKNG